MYDTDLTTFDDKTLLTIHRQGIITDEELLEELTHRGHKYPQLMVNANNQTNNMVNINSFSFKKRLERIMASFKIIDRIMSGGNK